MRPALIIFVRNAEAGKVKTRIAATAGASVALQVYEKLLQQTFACTSLLSCDRYVFYTDRIGTDDVWATGNYYKMLQAAGDLGRRMQLAFEAMFAKGYERVCIIGSDCAALSGPIIEEAFASLQQHDLVIGPAKDGGYYLLGMRNSVQPVFQNIAWSTSQVFFQTMQQANAHALHTHVLPILSDVDTIEDVPAGWL